MAEMLSRNALLRRIANLEDVARRMSHALGPSHPLTAELARVVGERLCD